jgi:hypothetical protein
MENDGIKIGAEIENEKLKAIAKRVARACELAGDKAVANLTDPASFPMPKESDALEHVMRKRLQLLHPVKQENAKNMVKARINAAPAVRQKMFADLVAVSLKKDMAVSQQVKALPIPADLKLAANFVSEMAPISPSVSPLAAPPAANGHKKLTLRIHSVKCVDETGTGGLFGTEGFGDDEISLGGTVVGVTGTTAKVSPFNVSSSFEDGDVKNFNPLKPFFTFDLTKGKQFPKTVIATLVLAERDMGGISDFIDALTEKIEDQVTNLLAGLGESQVPGSGIIARPIIDWCVDKVFDYLKSVWSDDVFKPATLSVKISSPTHTFNNGKIHSPDQTITFKGHDGAYELKHDWLLSA